MNKLLFLILGVLAFALLAVEASAFHGCDYGYGSNYYRAQVYYPNAYYYTPFYYGPSYPNRIYAPNYRYRYVPTNYYYAPTYPGYYW